MNFLIEAIDWIFDPAATTVASTASSRHRVEHLLSSACVRCWCGVRV